MSEPTQTDCQKPMADSQGAITVAAGGGVLLLTLDEGRLATVVVCVDFHQPRFEAVPGARFLGPAQLKEAA